MKGRSPGGLQCRCESLPICFELHLQCSAHNLLHRCCMRKLFAISRRSFAVLIVLTLAASASAQTETATQAAARPTIVFMTDFGTVDDAVPICKGVMLGIAPTARIIDLTHHVTPFNIREGARFLYGTTPYYPAGTIFVVVVDPTVGSSRKEIIVKSKKGQ